MKSARRFRLETLERRQLLVASETLPFVLDFSSSVVDTIRDKNGSGTGFSIVHTDRFRQDLIDLRPGAGVLQLVTTGDATSGSNYEFDNTLTNGLQSQFNAAAGEFQISLTLQGPLDYINTSAEQVGILFGKNQDNYIKLVVENNGADTAVQLYAETKPGSSYVQPLGRNGTRTLLSTPQLGTTTSLELILTANPVSKRFRGFFRRDGGDLQKLQSDLVLTDAQAAVFFQAQQQAGVMAQHKNAIGPISVRYDRFAILAGAPTFIRPSVTTSTPLDGETDVRRDIALQAELSLPSGGVDTQSIRRPGVVQLIRVSDQNVIPGNANTSGGGDVITFTPDAPLDAFTAYRWEITDDVLDVAGNRFVEYAVNFTTGGEGANYDPTIAWQQIDLPTAQGRSFTTVTLGPDNRLYAADLAGRIVRYAINVDETLGAAEVISTIVTREGGRRFITGITFDPRSTATKPILWVTHGQASFTNASDWTGKITRLTGKNLDSALDAVVNLPRSSRDHMTNQLVFGPGGAMYFGQASNSAYGAPDEKWGLRPERLLTASILRIDVNLIENYITQNNGPLDVKTEDVTNAYDPFADGAPLTIYATGLRNTYDLIAHSNGNLYAPTNGSASGGNSPGNVGAGIPALESVQNLSSDYLFNIRPGRYYGHPNPLRGEYVLFGGNPTSAVDPQEAAQYPVGVAPQRKWYPASYIFGPGYSPDGAIEYKADVFGGKLKNRILVTRYSRGDDIAVMSVNPDGSIGQVQTGFFGLTGFNGPLDLVENPRTGSLYVVEHDGAKITLVKPFELGGRISVDTPALQFSDIKDTRNGDVQYINILNTGTKPLALPKDAFNFSGTDAANFVLAEGTLPRTILPGRGATFGFAMNARPEALTDRVLTAKLNIKSNDAQTPNVQIDVRALAQVGPGGELEPSLDRLFELFQKNIDVGDTNPNNVGIDNINAGADDQYIPRFIRAGSGAVEVIPLASFGPDNESTTSIFGYYEPGTPANRKEVFRVDRADQQTVFPDRRGSSAFDPGTDPFGLYLTVPDFVDAGVVRTVFSEEQFNTWDSNAANRRRMRVYPNKVGNTVVPNEFIVTFDEFPGVPDQNDLVVLVKNVKYAGRGPELGIVNLDGGANPNWLTMSRIQNEDVVVGNDFHDRAKVRVINTGNRTLSISALTVSGGSDFALVAGPSLPVNLAQGESIDLTISFNATAGPVRSGSLTIVTNDADEPQKRIELRGIFQQYSEIDPITRVGTEPSLQQIADSVGAKVATVWSNQTINTSGRRVAVGDEVLSSYWQAADVGSPVTVRQIASYHTAGEAAEVAWFRQGQAWFSSGDPRFNAATNGPRNTLFFSESQDAQSMYPRIAGRSDPAFAAFSTDSIFGFRVDGEFSDNTINIKESNDIDGHHMRFYPLRDAAGQFVPDTFLMSMDYRSINFDYNDNVFIVNNIRPAGKVYAPRGLTAVGGAGGVALQWAEDTGASGFAVYRSAQADKGFSRISTGVLTGNSFRDTTAAAGRRAFYRLVALNADGTESIAASVNAVRPV